MKKRNFFIFASKRYLYNNVIIVFFLLTNHSCVATVVSTSVPTQSATINKFQLNQCKSVAVLVTSSAINVKYSRDLPRTSGIFGIFGFIPLVLAQGVEEITKSSDDSSNAKMLREKLDQKNIEKLLGDLFIENIQKSNIPKIVFSNNRNYDELIRAKAAAYRLRMSVCELTSSLREDSP